MWSQWESKNKRMFSHSRMENWNKWKPTIKVASSHINLVYVMFRMHKNTYTRINVYQPTYILQNDIMIIHPFWFGYINFHKYILYFIVFKFVQQNALAILAYNEMNIIIIRYIYRFNFPLIHFSIVSHGFYVLIIDLIDRVIWIYRENNGVDVHRLMINTTFGLLIEFSHQCWIYSFFSDRCCHLPLLIHSTKLKVFQREHPIKLWPNNDIIKLSLNIKFPL